MEPLHQESARPDETEATISDGRSALLIFGGFVVVGMLLTLLLFGGSLFGNEDAADESPSILQQVPALGGEGETAVLPNSAGPLSVGDVAHDFVLSDLDGNQVQLSDFRGQPVIVNFWATWCGPCRIEMPELQAAYETYQEDGLVILALDQDETADVVRAFFIDEMGLTFTPLLDDGGEVSERYSTFNFPTTFFIDGDGKITAIHRGPMVQSQIEDYLADTLPAVN